jgi:TPM domain
VLNAGRVEAEAAKLPAPILIYTTKTFNGDQDALNQYTREQLPNQNAIAIGIDTVHRHLSIESGTNVQLSDSQANDALSAFQNNFNGGDYTGATVAAIDTLQNALSGGSNSGGGITPLGVAVAILLCLALVVFVVIVIIRRKTGGSNRPPGAGGKRKMESLYTPYPYYGGNHPISAPPPPPSGNYGGGAGGSFGGGSSGGGAGGSF